MDIFTARKRSQIMSRIRSTGTVPEERLFQIVQSVVGRRRTILRNARHVRGCPDIFIPSLNVAFFVDGCFFHGCPIHGHVPHTNSEYWQQKIARNMRRDLRNRRSLRRSGVSVWRFWEHELRPTNDLVVAARIALSVRRAINCRASEKQAVRSKKHGR